MSLLKRLEHETEKLTPLETYEYVVKAYWKERVLVEGTKNYDMDELREIVQFLFEIEQQSINEGWNEEFTQLTNNLNEEAQKHVSVSKAKRL